MIFHTENAQLNPPLTHKPSALFCTVTPQLGFNMKPVIFPLNSVPCPCSRSRRARRRSRRRSRAGRRAPRWTAHACGWRRGLRRSPVMENDVRGDVHMTSSKFSEFWTPSLLLSVPNSCNLPSFHQILADPLPPPQCRRHWYIAPKLRHLHMAAKDPRPQNRVTKYMYLS